MTDRIDGDGNSRMLLAGRVLAFVLALLVFVQAVMAGNSSRLFGRWSIVAHGVVGNTTFLLAIAGLVIAIVGRLGRSAVGAAAVLVVLMTVQIGLGYSGRTSLDSAALHIPNGVAIFGLAVYNITVYQGRTRAATPAGTR